MNLAHLFPSHAVNHLYLALLQAGIPGEGLLNSILAFIVGPFGKAITLIAIVLCGVSYMYGKQSDNSSIGRLAIFADACRNSSCTTFTSSPLFLRMLECRVRGRWAGCNGSSPCKAKGAVCRAFASKWAVATVINGKVYVPAENQLVVFGLK